MQPNSNYHHQELKLGRLLSGVVEAMVDSKGRMGKDSRNTLSSQVNMVHTQEELLLETELCLGKCFLLEVVA